MTPTQLQIAAGKKNEYNVLQYNVVVGMLLQFYSVYMKLREPTDFRVCPKATAIGKWTNKPRWVTSWQ